MVENTKKWAATMPKMSLTKREGQNEKEKNTKPNMGTVP